LTAPVRTDASPPAVPGNVVGLPDGPIVALRAGRYPVVALAGLAGADGLAAGSRPAWR
jgi:hypothetical protein